MSKFLEKYLNYIRWGVLIFSWIAIALATHHYDSLMQDRKQLVVVETQIKEVKSVKVVHNKVNALPVGDAASQLFKDWSR